MSDAECPRCGEPLTTIDRHARRWGTPPRTRHVLAVVLLSGRIRITTDAGSFDFDRQQRVRIV
jgi:hypothetical protein